MICYKENQLPAADGQACSGGYVRVRVWLGSESGPSQSPSVLSITAQGAGTACRGFIMGAGGLPLRHGFSCMCTTWVPFVPAVGAAPVCLCLVPRWHWVRCDVRVVCWLDALQRPGRGFSVSGSCSVDGLHWWAGVCCVCLWWFPAIVPACLCIPNHRVSLQHTSSRKLKEGN